MMPYSQWEQMSQSLKVKLEHVSENFQARTRKKKALGTSCSKIMELIRKTDCYIMDEWRVERQNKDLLPADYLGAA